MQKKEQTFGWEALIRIAVAGVIAYLLWKSLSVFPVILIAAVLAAAVYPIVKLVQRKLHLPLLASIFLILIVPIVPFVILGVMFVPRIAAEVPHLLSSLNAIVSQSDMVRSFFGNSDLMTYAQSHFDYATATINVAHIVFACITTVVLTFFLVYDFERLSELFLHVVAKKERPKVKELMEEIAHVTGKYIRGNVLISIICGVVIFIGLSLLGIPYALPLAVFAALFDLLPLVGQTIGAIPAVIIGFGISPLTGVFVIALYVISQQAENAIISPLIYNKALNLYPSISFLSVLIGASLFGILGAFLALPVAASIPAVIHYHKNYAERHALIKAAN